MQKNKSIICIFTIFIMIMGMLCYTPVPTVKASTLVLKASKLKEAVSDRNSEYAQYIDASNALNVDQSIILEMDDSLHLKEDSLIDGDLIIRGERTLFIDDTLAVFGNVTIETGARVALNKTNSNINVLSYDSVYNFKTYGDIVINNSSKNIWGDVDFYMLGGSIKVANSNNCIRAEKAFIEAGTIEGTDSFCILDMSKDIEIKGGSLDFTSNQSAPQIFSEYTINITGGSITGTSETGAIIIADTIYMNGGYFKGTTNSYSENYSPIMALSSMSFGDKSEISIPQNSKTTVVVKKIQGGTVDYSVVCDSSESVAMTVEISDKKEDNKDKEKDKSDKNQDDDEGSGENSGNGTETKDGSGDKKDSNNSTDKNSGNSTNTNTNNSGNNNSNNNPGNNPSDKGKSDKPSNEWIDGKWYNSDGSQTYKPTGSWKSDETGWWFEDSSGWYPISQWQKIDGKWYYFTETGYMDYSEYRDGCWLGADGAWVEEYYGAQWKMDATGWGDEDASGWYPVNEWVWIDGVNYFFKSDGYLDY